MKTIKTLALLLATGLCGGIVANAEYTCVISEEASNYSKDLPKTVVVKTPMLVSADTVYVAFANEDLTRDDVDKILDGDYREMKLTDVIHEDQLGKAAVGWGFYFDFGSAYYPTFSHYNYPYYYRPYYSYNRNNYRYDVHRWRWW